MSTLTALLHLLLLFFFSALVSSHGEMKGSEMVPIGASGFGSLVFNDARRKLNSFQICALCTCCGGPNGGCLPAPCCYAINCNIPNKPFGFCSFTPRTCNCFGCHL